VSKPPTTTFEELLAELQATVNRLETEQLTLDEAVTCYERSVALANACSEMLEQAELRITQIDSDSRSIREQATAYRIDQFEASRLLLGDDDDDLTDLLDLDDE
jgi:exodeoxyribonuclease VII small subunit